MFDATINLGHLIEVALIIGSAIGAYFKMDKRLALIEDRVSRLQDDTKEIKTDFVTLRHKVSMRGTGRQ